MALILKDAKGNQIEFPTLYGYSIYYYPEAVQGEINTDTSINLSLIDKTEDREIQVGDLVISNNGKLCRVTSLSNGTAVILVNLGQGAIQDVILAQNFKTADNTWTQAINTAIDSVESGTVVLPSGELECDGAIVLKSNICLQGQGIQSTILKFGETHGIIAKPLNYLQCATVKDLTLCGNTNTMADSNAVFPEFNPNQHGIYWETRDANENLYECYRCSIENVYVKNFAGTGVYVPYDFNNLYQRVYVSCCAGNGIEIAGLNTCRLESCYVDYINPNGEYCAYRVYQNAVLDSCNGIGGTGNYWGVFGRNEAGEFESGIDRAIAQHSIVFNNCNIEDFGKIGCKFLYAGGFAFHNSSFYAPVPKYTDNNVIESYNHEYMISVADITRPSVIDNTPILIKQKYEPSPDDLPAPPPICTITGTSQIINLNGDEIKCYIPSADFTIVLPKINVNDSPSPNRTIRISDLKVDRLYIGDTQVIVTPEMLGAVGDGETDDTEAFKKMDGMCVLLSAKTYRVRTVTYGAGTRLIGAGMTKTIIKQFNGVDDDLIVFSDAYGGGIQDLTIEGNFDTEGESSINTNGLLKIQCTDEAGEEKNQDTMFKGLSIKNARSNCLYIKGKESLTGKGAWNWVLQMHDIRCSKAGYYAMVDESCDNRFSQFYLNGGERGGLLLYKASSNTYSDFKIDWSGAINEDDITGALLVAKECALLNFSNFDLQSAQYCGAKFTNCRGIRFNGDINNCGLNTAYEGRCLQLNSCRDSQFNFSASYVAAPQKYNVVIDDECVNCDCNIQEAYKTENINNSPASCFIRNSSAMAGNYAGALNLNKPLINYMPLNTWKATNGEVFDIEFDDFRKNYSQLGSIIISVDGKVKIRPYGSTIGITRAITGLQAGDLYLIGCKVSTSDTLEAGERIWLTIGAYGDTDKSPQAILNNPSDFDISLTEQFIYSVVRIRSKSIRASLFTKTNRKSCHIEQSICIRLADLPGMAYPSSKSLNSLIENLSDNLTSNSVEYSVGFEEVFDLVKDLNTSHQNFITPQMYGAKGDGITDDTRAVQECVANNNKVFFPQGTYLMKEPLIIDKANMILVGEDGATISDAPKGSTNLLFENCSGLVFKNGSSNNWYNTQTRFFTFKGINLLGQGAKSSFDTLMKNESYDSICCAIKIDSTSLFKFQFENCMIKNFHVGITDNFGEVTSVIYNGSFKHMYIVNTEYAIHLGWTRKLGYGHFGIKFEDIYIDGGKLRLNEGNYSFDHCNFGIYNVDQFDFSWSFHGTWTACNFECDVNVVPVKGLIYYERDFAEEAQIGGISSNHDCSWLFHLIGVHNFVNCGFTTQGYKPLAFFHMNTNNGSNNEPRAITFTHCKSGNVKRKLGETRTSSDKKEYTWTTSQGGEVKVTYPTDIYKQSNYLPAGSKITIDEQTNEAEWIYNVTDLESETSPADPTIWEDLTDMERLEYSKKFIFNNNIDMDILKLELVVLAPDGKFKRIIFNEDNTVTWEDFSS